MDVTDALRRRRRRNGMYDQRIKSDVKRSLNRRYGFVVASSIYIRSARRAGKHCDTSEFSLALPILSTSRQLLADAAVASCLREDGATEATYTHYTRRNLSNKLLA